MATISDVATHAGVSIKTVSKVLAGDLTVRPRLKARIMEAIEALNYRPALAARQLASGKSFLIALLVPALPTSYYARMILSVSQSCAQRGYHAIIETFSDDADLGDETKLRLSCEPDAIIVGPPLSNNPRLLEALASFDRPVVRIAANAGGPGIAVPVSGREAASQVVEHLIAAGHRRIGMLAPPSARNPADDRRLGYLDALERHGIAAAPELVARTDFDFPSGAQAARQLLALAQRPTAIFGGNDLVALGALAMAQSLGFTVSSDLAIAGFDNSPESRHVFPALTTVDQPIADIARCAVDAAIAGTFSPVAFAHQMIVRGSTTGERTVCLEDRFAELRTLLG